MTRQTNAPLSEQHQPAGLARDLHRIKKHGGMSLAELREFISKLHGRNPGEVLGLVSSSAFIRAIVESTVYCGILMVLLTVVPFMLAGEKEEPRSNSDTAAAFSSEMTSPDPRAVAGSSPGSMGSDDSISAEDANKAIDAMGLGETKTADPNKNPLDNLDSLLDDVK